MIKIINQTLCLKLIHKSLSISNLLNSLNVSVFFLHLLVFVNDQFFFLLLNKFLLHVVPSFLITSLIHLCFLLCVFIGRPSSKFAEIVNVLFSSFYFLIGGGRQFLLNISSLDLKVDIIATHQAFSGNVYRASQPSYSLRSQFQQFLKKNLFSWWCGAWLNSNISKLQAKQFSIQYLDEVLFVDHGRRKFRNEESVSYCDVVQIITSFNYWFTLSFFIDLILIYKY